MRLTHPGLELALHVTNLAPCVIEDKLMNLYQRDLSNFGLPKLEELNKSTEKCREKQDTVWKNCGNEPLLNQVCQKVLADITNNSEGFYSWTHLE